MQTPAIEWLARIRVGDVDEVAGLWLRRDLVATVTSALAPLDTFDFGERDELSVTVAGRSRRASLVEWNGETGVCIIEVLDDGEDTEPIWLPRLLLSERLGSVLVDAPWRIWGRTADGHETFHDGVGFDPHADGLFRLRGVTTLDGFAPDLGGPVASVGSDSVLGVVGPGGTMVPLDVFLDARPSLAGEFGWRMDSAMRLRILWRVEDDMLGRPTLGSMFVGRTKALEDLAGDSDGARSSLQVVTGSAGVGKSALLAQFVLHGSRDVDAAMHLRDVSVVEFAQFLAHSFSLSLSDRSRQFEQAEERDRLTIEIADIATTMGRSPLIVLDALDEAGPDARAIALMIDRLCQHGVRVVVGVRIGSFNALERTWLPSLVIDLDRDEYFDRADLVRYIEGLIDLDPERAGDAVPEVIITAIASAAGRNFLVAGLVALAVRSDAETDVGSRSASDGFPVFPDNVQDAMVYFVQRIPADGYDIWGILAPLALSFGDGLPFDLWVRLSSALAGAPVDAEHVRRCRTSAVDYLIETSTVNGERCFRLFHDALAETVRNRWSGRSRSVPDGHKAIFETLASDWRSRSLAGDTSYTRLHLPLHAACSDAIDDFIEDGELLAYCDPSGTLAALQRVENGQTGTLIEIVKSVFHLLGDDGPRNAATLRLHALYQGDGAIALRFKAVALRSSVMPMSFGHVGDLVPVSERSGHSDWVTAVLASGELESGINIFSASSDQTVREWSVAGTGDSARASTRCLFHHADCVRSIDRTTTGQTDWLVTGGDDAVVQVRSSASVAREGIVLLGHRSWVRSVVAIDEDGRLFVLSGSDDGTIRLWDPVADAPEIGRFRQHNGWVLAVAHIDGTPFAASAGQDGHIYMWRLWGEEAGLVDTHFAHVGPVRALHAREHAGRRLLVSVGDDGAFVLWQVDEMGMLKALMSHAASSTSLRAVAAEDWAGRLHVVTAGTDQHLAIHELDEQLVYVRSIGRRQHNDWVRSISLLPSIHGGDLGIVTGGDDGSVEVARFDGATISPIISLADNNAWLRTSLSLGSGHTVAAGAGGQILVWDGAPSDTPSIVLPGHDHWVRALHHVQGDDEAFLSCGDDGRVLRWAHTDAGWSSSALIQHTSPLRALTTWTARDGVTWIGACGDDGKVHVFPQIAPGRRGSLRRGPGGSGWLRALASFECDGVGFIAAGGDDRRIYLWRQSGSDDPVLVSDEHPSAIRALLAVEHGASIVLLSTTDSGDIQVFEVHSDAILRQQVVLAHKGSGLGLCTATVDGVPLIVSASADQTIATWSLSDLSVPRHVLELHSPNYSVHSRRDGTVVVVNQRGVVGLVLR